MAELAGAALAVVAGAMVGLASCALWLTLKLPMRVMDVFDAGSARLCGWAIVLGSVSGTLGEFMGWTLAQGAWLLVAFMLLAGVFVGMVASALTETLNVLPQCFERLGLGDRLKLLAWALALGKAIGALIATLLPA
jgi:stage V sporulation protein AB